MNGRITSAALALGGLVGFVVLWTRPADAFDSSGPDIKPQTHVQPTPPAPWPFGGTYFQANPDHADDIFDQFDVANNTYNFELQMVHDLLGYEASNGLDPDTNSVGGVLQCLWPLGPPTTGDLTTCFPWPVTSTDKMPGWAKVHRSWSTRANGTDQNTSAPEHMDIAIASANAAGLASLPLFSSTLWLRYAVNGTWLATKAGSPNWVVAPSWQPVDFSAMGALATRGFRLAELAQLPDVSNTVWDWAAGDEVCPQDGLDGPVVLANGTQATVSAFGDPTNDVNACHDFGRVMGATNASHFLPLAETYYHYYHTLALQREAQCRTMAANLQSIYAWQLDGVVAGEGLDWAPYRSPNDTEVNVCEQEAFTYEMNAQHYLQDAWSSGHMWARWGYPDLGSFPTGGGDPVNLPAQRMAIAGAIGMYAGTIHGAKGVTGQWGLITSALGQGVNDPLCGPTYDDPNTDAGPSLVKWTLADGGATNAGVGDIFYNPVSGPANLSTGQNYTEQYQRLVACGARSLYDVYAAGPMSYGTATAGDVQGLLVKDGSLTQGAQFDAYCFSQAATNASMSGSLGAFYLTRNWGQLTPDFRSALFSLVNTAIFTIGVGKVTWPLLTPTSDFLSSFFQGMGTDVQKLKAIFNTRAVTDKNGTTSAKLAGGVPGSQLTLFGVPPNAPPADPTKPPSSFADIVTPQLSGTPQDAVRRLFWRAHPEDVCSEELVTDLAARCQAGAQVGGDPEACTACVDLTELQVPTCALSPDAFGALDIPTIIGSKCSAMGDQVDTSLLPQQWWDPASRYETSTCGTYPSYWLAFYYCTGTSPTLFPNSVYGETGLSSVVTESCPDPFENGTDFYAYTDQVLEAEAFPELSQTDQTVRPVVVAWNEAVTLLPGPTPCSSSNFTNDQDARAQALYPFDLWQDAAHTTPAIVGGDETLDLAPHLAVCGFSQRLTYWDRSCDDVFGRYGSVMNLGNAVPGGPPDPATGAQILSSSFTDDDEQRCSVREAQTFSTTCPTNNACSTSGLCVPARDPHGTPIAGLATRPQVHVLP
jgi:hypothetical protein